MAGKWRLKRLFANCQPQAGALAGEFQCQIGSDETGPTGNENLLVREIHFSLGYTSEGVRSYHRRLGPAMALSGRMGQKRRFATQNCRYFG
jgi:hypothetical protein